MWAYQRHKRSLHFLSSLRWLIIILILFLVLFATHLNAQADFLDRLLRLTDDVAKVSTKTATNTTRLFNALTLIPKTGHKNRWALSIEGEGLVLHADTGAKTILASSTALVAGTALSPEVLTLLGKADLLIPEEYLDDLKDILTKVSEHSKRAFYTLTPDESVKPIHIVKTENSHLIAIEERPGVLISANDEVHSSLRWALSQILLRHQTKIVSLFDDLDVDVLSAFNRKMGELHVPLQSLIRRDVVGWIQKQKRQTIIVVGHVEGDAFVVRNPAGQVVAKIDFVSLDAAARQTDSTVIYLGCETANRAGVTGFLTPVNALRVADALGAAIQQETLSGFFETIAKDTGTLMVRQSIADHTRLVLDAQRALITQERQSQAQAVFLTIRLSTLTRARAPGLAEWIVPGILSRIQYVYLLGLFFLFFQMRSRWQTWKEIWWDSPNPQAKRMYYIMSSASRLGLFLVMMPFTVLLRTFLPVLGAFIGGYMLWKTGPSALVFFWFFLEWYPGYPEGIPEPFVERPPLLERILSPLLLAAVVLFPFSIALWVTEPFVSLLVDYTVPLIIGTVEGEHFGLAIIQWLLAGVYIWLVTPRVVSLLEKFGITISNLLDQVAMFPVWLIRYGTPWILKRTRGIFWKTAH
jgi:hypothetical protein